MKPIRNENGKVSNSRRAVQVRNAYIIDAYASNVPIKEICKKTGLTYGSLKVIASRLGCTKVGKDVYDYRRGFVVPDHLKADYDHLVFKKGHTSKEAAQVLGILPMAGVHGGWMPISGAPRDGSEFMAYIENYGWEPRARFNAEAKVFELYWCVDGVETWGSRDYMTPTHWQPQPVSPEGLKT